MSNWVALIIIAALLMLRPLEIAFDFPNDLHQHSYTLAEIAAAVMMLANGTLTDRKYFTAIYFLLGLVIVGVMFKIMHWTGADQLLIFCPTALVIIYIIHFITKPAKGILDILKLLTVISYAVIGVSVLFHWVQDSWTLRFVGAIIFWSTFAWFLVEGVWKKRLFTRANP